MKSLITNLSLIFGALILASLPTHAQNIESGVNIGPNPIIVNAPENSQWLSKEGRVRSGQKSVYFYEDFEAPTEAGALPAGWTQKRTTTPAEEPVTDAVTPMWFRNSTTYGFADPFPYIYSGQASMAIGYTAPDFTWAISPEFSIPETEGDVNLSYWAWIRSALPTGFPEPVITNYLIKVKADGEWFTLLSYFGVDGEENLFEEQIVLSMNPFKGKNVQIAFVYEYYGWQMAVDEIFVGEELENDFGIADLTAFPTFGLLQGDQVDLGVDVYCNGNNSGSVEVSLVVNDELYATHTTQVLSLGGEAEYVLFNWIAPSDGDFDIKIVLPADDFDGNNMLQQDIMVNQYFNLAEDFENFEFDELGIPNLVFPPVGWGVSDAAWVTETEQWPIFDGVSAMLHGRLGEGEKTLYTLPVDVSPLDEWISFYLAGINNSVDVGETEGATPPGVQGFSTFQLKYAPSLSGPWTNLGDPVDFVLEWHIDNNGDTIGSTAPNAERFMQYDISSLSGTNYFAFSATSNFNLVIGQTVYRSFVIIDNVMIGRDPVEDQEVVFNVADVSANPLEDVMLYLYLPDALIYSGKTNNLGSVNLSMSPGDYTYKAMKLGYTITEGEISVIEITSGKENENVFGIELLVPDNLYTVTFQVNDDLGASLPDAKVLLEGYFYEGLTNNDGELAIAGFVPGLFESAVSLDGYVAAEATFEVIDADIEVTVVLIRDDVGIVDSRVENVTIYPNPASDILFIKSGLTIQSYSIVDITGKTVIQQTVANAPELSVNIDQLNEGVYFLKVYTANGIRVQKLIINR